MKRSILVRPESAFLKNFKNLAHPTQSLKLKFQKNKSDFQI